MGDPLGSQIAGQVAGQVRDRMTNVRLRLELPGGASGDIYRKAGTVASVIRIRITSIADRDAAAIATLLPAPAGATGTPGGKGSGETS